MRENFCTKLSLVLFILFFNVDINGQSSAPKKQPVSVTDELLQKLEKAKQDTARVNLLNELVEELRKQTRVREVLPYGERMVAISEKNLANNPDPVSLFIFRKGKAKGYNTMGSYFGAMGNYTEGLKNHFKAIEIQKEIGAKYDLADSYFRIGNTYRQLRDYDKALESYLNELKVASEVNDKKKIVEAHKWVGSAYSLKSDNKQALKYFNLWLKSAEEINDKTSIADAHTDLGIFYQNLGAYETALKHYNLSLSFHRGWMADNKITENTNRVADCYHNIAVVHLIRGNFPASLNNALLALKIREQTQNAKGTAIEKLLIGDSYYHQQNYAEALIHFRDALRNLENFKDNYFLSDCYFSIGQTLSFQGKFQEAIDNTLQSLKLSEEVKDKRGISRAYIVLANAYLGDRKFSEAIKYCFKSLELIELTQDKNALAAVKATLGATYMNFPDSLTLAKKYLEESALLYKSLQGKKDIEGSLKNLAEINFRLQNYKEAYENYKQFVAYKDSTSNNDVTEKLTRLRMQYDFDKKEAIVKLEEEKKLSEQKLKFEKEKALNDLALSKQKSLLQAQSLLATQKENELTLLSQAKFIQDLELEKNKTTLKQQDLLLLAKNKDLQLLNKDKALQAALIEKERSNRNMLIAGFGILLFVGGGTFYSINQKRKLSFSKQVSEVELKALRAQMNPHFIFNSLSSIHSLIQANNQKAASAYLLQFSKLTRVVLENSSKQYISLADELEALKLYLDLENLRMNDKLSYELKADPSIDQENTLIPPLILQPFLENAILHGLQHKEDVGKINIAINRQNGMLKCVITDNGIGIKRSKEIKLSSFAAKKESLGMKIVEQRISIINKMKKSNAYVAINDREDEKGDPTGVQVEIVLPIEQRF